MGAWDAREREQFRIDADNLKNDIDIIQSEKISNLRDYVDKINNKTELELSSLKSIASVSEIKNNILSSKLKTDNENMLSLINRHYGFVESELKITKKKNKQLLIAVVVNFIISLFIYLVSRYGRF